MLGQGADPERSDDELAAEDVNGTLVAVIPLPTWSRIRLAGLDHAVLVAAERGSGGVYSGRRIARHASGHPASSGLLPPVRFAPRAPR